MLVFVQYVLKWNTILKLENIEQLEDKDVELGIYGFIHSLLCTDIKFVRL